MGLCLGTLCKPNNSKNRIYNMSFSPQNKKIKKNKISP